MIASEAGGGRPPIHLLASESDLVATLALRAEHRHPVVAAMLLEEIERAELHDADEMPEGHIRLNSRVTFIDERSGQARSASTDQSSKARSVSATRPQAAAGSTHIIVPAPPK